MAVRAFSPTSALVAVSLLLSACGSGGGTTTATTSGGGTTTAGSSTHDIAPPATLDSTTVAPITDEVFLTAQLINETASNLPGLNKTDNGTQTVYGTSGLVNITLNLDSNGNGTLVDVYTNYGFALDNSIKSGTITVTYSKYSATVLQYSNVIVQRKLSTYTYNGTLKITSLFPLSATADLSVSTSHGTLALSGFAINSSYSASGDKYTVAINGTLSDSTIGSVKIATVSPVAMDLTPNSNSDFSDVLPTGSSGEVTLSGANGAVLYIAPLNSQFIALGLDSTGSAGAATKGSRLDRSTGQLDDRIENGGNIESVAELAADVSLNALIRLDGRYSHSVSGLVSYKWKLVASPAGSTVALSSDTSTTSFQPDVQGGYTLSLTVSDGAHSASDYVEVDYPGDSTDSASMATQFKIPAFLSSPVGTTITLDARSSPDTTDGSWLLQTPAGSSAMLSSDSDLEPNFTPDLPGTYVLTYCDNPSSGCLTPIGYGIGSNYSDVMVVEAGISTPVRFGPMTPIGTLPSNFYLSAWSAGNFTGNGRDSFAFVGTNVDTSSAEMLVYPSTSDAPGNFAADQISTLPGMGIGSSVQFSDINGDGIPDWVANTGTGTTAYLSGSGGYTTSVVPDGGKFGVGTIENKQALAYVDMPSIGGYSNLQPAAYLMNSGSFSTTPILSTAINPNLRMWGSTGVGLGDFDGDNITDLATVTTDALTFDKLWIYHGNGDGTFTHTKTFDLNDADNALHNIFVTDMYGNGKPDIVVTDGNGWHVFAGDGKGNFTNEGTTSLQCGIYDCQIVNFKNSATPDLIGPPGASCGPDCPGIYFLLPTAGTLNGTWYSYPTSVGVKVRVGDFNNDGIPDLYLEDGSEIYVMPGLNADGSLP